MYFIPRDRYFVLSCPFSFLVSWKTLGVIRRLNRCIVRRRLVLRQTQNARHALTKSIHPLLNSAKRRIVPAVQSADDKTLILAHDACRMASRAGEEDAKSQSSRQRGNVRCQQRNIQRRMRQSAQRPAYLSEESIEACFADDQTGKSRTVPGPASAGPT